MGGARAAGGERAGRSDRDSETRRCGQALVIVLAATALTAAACTGGTAHRASGPTATSAVPVTRSAPSIPSRPMMELQPRVRAIRVGAAPDWQVAAFGSVWVANDPPSIVQRIDARTDRVVARLRVAPFAKPCDGMAAGFGSLWVPDCSTQDVDRVDPHTNRVIARIHAGIADFESYIAVGGGSVWIVSAPDEVTRIDASTNRIAARIAVPDGSAAVAFGWGFAWVTNHTNDVVTKVDASTNKAVDTIDVGGGPRFLAAGEGSVWVLNQDDGTVSRIDPATGEVTTIDAGSPGEGGCIATGFGAVWVTVPEFPFTRIDAKTGRVTEHFRGPGGDCLSVGSGSVWLSNLHSGEVWRIPPT